MEWWILLGGALLIVAGVVLNWRWAAANNRQMSALDEREYRLAVREADLAQRESRVDVWADFERRRNGPRRA